MELALETSYDHRYPLGDASDGPVVLSQVEHVQIENYLA